MRAPEVSGIICIIAVLVYMIWKVIPCQVCKVGNYSKLLGCKAVSGTPPPVAPMPAKLFWLALTSPVYSRKPVSWHICAQAISARRLKSLPYLM